MPVIVVAPHDELFEKTVSNMQEVAARGGKIVLIVERARRRRPAATLAAHHAGAHGDAFISPLLYAVPVQLLAYHTAVFMGTDVDQPRNLAKSVTVE